MTHQCHVIKVAQLTSVMCAKYCHINIKMGSMTFLKDLNFCKGIFKNKITRTEIKTCHVCIEQLHN